MKPKKMLLWVLTFLPLIVTLMALPILPDTIPAHYGISGVVDRWGSKYGTLALPIITIILIGMLQFFEQWGNKQKNSAKQNEKFLAVINYMLVFVFNGITYWMLYSAYTGTENLYDAKIDGMKLLAVMMSISFIFLGNILPKCKQNKMMGIRTKWTLANETVWYKTHRFGGRLMMLFGTVSAILCFTILDHLAAFVVTFGGLVLIIIPIMVYSYVIYKKLPQENEGA